MCRFLPSKINAEVSERPDLHFLTPIKRNDVHIFDNDILSFDGVLEGIDAKRKNTFSPEQYAKKKNLFGVIVLESDQDHLTAQVSGTNCIAPQG